jgi:hypothetical protein
MFSWIHPYSLQAISQFEIQSDPLDVFGFVIVLAVIIALIIFMNISKRIRNSDVFKGKGMAVKIGTNLKVDINFYNKVKYLGLSKKEAAVLEKILKSDTTGTGNPYDILSDRARVDENFKLAYKRILREKRDEDALADILELFAIRNAVELFLVSDKNMPVKNIARNFRRKDTNINCKICLVVMKSTNSNAPQKLVLQRDAVYVGLIQNISQGGCSIIAANILKINNLIKIDFNIEARAGAALGQVVRINKEANKFIYHIKFLKLSKQTIIDLNAFIFGYY